MLYVNFLSTCCMLVDLHCKKTINFKYSRLNFICMPDETNQHAACSATCMNVTCILLHCAFCIYQQYELGILHVCAYLSDSAVTGFSLWQCICVLLSCSGLKLGVFEMSRFCGRHLIRKSYDGKNVLVISYKSQLSFVLGAVQYRSVLCLS